MNKTFQTIRRQGVKLLVLPMDRNQIALSDDEGNNYGSYYDVASFDKFLAQAADGIKSLALGKVQVQQICINHPPITLLPVE